MKIIQGLVPIKEDQKDKSTNVDKALNKKIIKDNVRDKQS